MTKKLIVFVLTACLLIPLSVANAAETNVYGDPGSGDFSVALAIAADSSGNAVVMGAFFGDFQGNTSTGWDLWIAGISDDGSFDWIQTWDAPHAEGFLATTPSYQWGAWANPIYELLVDDDNQIRGRVGTANGMTLVSVGVDGSHPAHTVVGIDIAMAALVPDGSGDIVGFLDPTAPIDATDPSTDQVLVRVKQDGSLVWASPIPHQHTKTLLVLSDSSAVVGQQLPRLDFQNPAVRVSAVDNEGEVLWNTEIFDACIQGGTEALLDMGDRVGLVVSSPSCNVDEPERVPTLSLSTGQRLSNQVIKDSLNIISCQDPRLETLTEITAFGFVDGDECDGGDVIWLDVNYNLISEGTAAEGMAIVGMELVNTGYRAYGVLRTVADGTRWKLDRIDWIGPSEGFVPWDMAMTKHGAVVVGRVSNTAWVSPDSSLTQANPASQGAAALVTVNIPSSRTFLPKGSDTIGLVDPTQGKWYLYDNSGATSFFFGNPGDVPIMGDWNCDNIETPGMYRQSDGYVYLRNSNTQGNADIKFYFGDPGDMPLAGDFNGDGCDTVSIYRPSTQTFHIVNKLGENNGGLGSADQSYVFGNPGDAPFVGDFNGNGVETVGLHRAATGLVYFRNSHSQGNADAQFVFGDPGDRFVAGNWTGSGAHTPALFRPSNSTTYFRFSNTQGIADYAFQQGEASWLPVAGRTDD